MTSSPTACSLMLNPKIDIEMHMPKRRNTWLPWYTLLKIYDDSGQFLLDLVYRALSDYLHSYITEKQEPLVQRSSQKTPFFKPLLLFFDF